MIFNRHPFWQSALRLSKFRLSPLILPFIGLFLVASLALGWVAFIQNAEKAQASYYCPNGGSLNSQTNTCTATNKICNNGNILNTDSVTCLTGFLPDLDLLDNCTNNTYSPTNDQFVLTDGFQKTVNAKLCIPTAYANFSTNSSSCPANTYSLPTDGNFTLFNGNTKYGAKLCVPQQYINISVGSTCPRTKYPIPDFISKFTGYLFSINDSADGRFLCALGDGFFDQFSYAASCPTGWQDAGGADCTTGAQTLAGPVPASSATPPPNSTIVVSSSASGLNPVANKSSGTGGQNPTLPNSTGSGTSDAQNRLEANLGGDSSTEVVRTGGADNSLFILLGLATILIVVVVMYRKKELNKINQDIKLS